MEKIDNTYVIKEYPLPIKPEEWNDFELAMPQLPHFLDIVHNWRGVKIVAKVNMSLPEQKHHFRIYHNGEQFTIDCNDIEHFVGSFESEHDGQKRRYYVFAVEEFDV